MAAAARIFALRMRIFPDLNRSTTGITLRAPVIMLVLAATAIPIEWRPLGDVPLGFDVQVSEFAANVAGYVPVGIVLGDLGPLRAVVCAALISTFAESSPFFMLHRDPAAIDVASNVCRRLRWRCRLRWFEDSLTRNHDQQVEGTGRSNAGVRARRWHLGSVGREPLNARGATSPGSLEAYWKFDENRGRIALDSSAHGVQGTFRRLPRHR